MEDESDVNKQRADTMQESDVNILEANNMKNKETAFIDQHSVISVEIRSKGEQRNQEKSESTHGTAAAKGDSNKDTMKKESSFVKTVKNEAEKVEQKLNSQTKTRSRKKMKKCIFVSYSPDAGFVERKFVMEMVKQLKDNNLAEDVWFDRDEQITDSPCWFSLRIESVERCKAAILLLSESYFTCPVSVYESKTLIQRQTSCTQDVMVYPVLFNDFTAGSVPSVCQTLLSKVLVDLTKAPHHQKSLAEQTSVTVGALMPKLEKHATIHASLPPFVPPSSEYTGQYPSKKICKWTTTDLQEWLFKLGIKEFYRQSLAEAMVDGFLLLSLTDQDMVDHLSIDSRVVRRKMMQQILATLDREQKLPGNWHLRARTVRPKAGCIYLVYDPTDVRLAQHLKADLTKRNFQVVHHQKLGQSKEEFLKLNCVDMATASHILVLLTEHSTSSPFVFHEVVFADWLGRKLVTAVFKNTWQSLRPSLKALLGECQAVDFETKMYVDSLSVLDFHLRPMKSGAGVVLEQAYLNRMEEGVKPLATLTPSQGEHGDGREATTHINVFISYQWDMQSRVDDLHKVLQKHGFACTTLKLGPTTGQRTSSGQSGKSGVSSPGSGGQSGGESMTHQQQRLVRTSNVVLCCVTPKYLQTDSCVKELTLADSLYKPILPVMLRFCPWPPEGTSAHLRQMLARVTPIDLSNDKLFRQNSHNVIDRLRKAAQPKRL